VNGGLDTPALPQRDLFGVRIDRPLSAPAPALTVTAPTKGQGAPPTTSVWLTRESQRLRQQ
jgi:hypothetical protein